MRFAPAIIILAVITTLPGCFENTETGLAGLPEHTTAGLDRVGAIINGKTVYNQRTTDVAALWSVDDNNLVLNFSLLDNSSIEMNLYIPDLSVRDFLVDSTQIIKVDTLHPELAKKYSSAGFTSNDPQCSYRAGGYFNKSVMNTAKIHFTRLEPTDPEKGVVSGAFEMSLKTENCRDVEIVDGRFDISMAPKGNGFH